jgi:uncharacterized protein
MADLGVIGIVVLAGGAAAGALVQAATGFGFAILAAPVFLWVLDSTVAVPILVALHVVQSAMLVPRVCLQAPRVELGRLAIGAAIGTPLGFLALGLLDVRHLKLAAGTTILVVAALLAWRRRVAAVSASTPEPRDGTGPAASALVAGAAAGALTALLVMPGPPLMVHLVRWPLAPVSARALSLTFFAGCYVAVLSMSIVAGSLGSADWAVVALLVLPVVAGTLAGQRLGRLLADRHFMIVLNGLLVLAGLGALLSAL